jgi:hypothetical protein
MLIVCTQDQIIRDCTADPNSGSPSWKLVTALSLGGQPGATVQFESELRRLEPGSPLALSIKTADANLWPASSDPPR